MGTRSGLSPDGITYFSDIASGNTKPGWMDFSTQIGKLTGNYTMVNLVSGIEGMERFLFRVPKWPIGGLFFDGILRTDHQSTIKATHYPVQSGVTMTDHAIIEPAELTIEVMMSDAHSMPFNSGSQFLDSVINSLNVIKSYSNFVPMTTDNMSGDGRSAKTWLILKAMQLSRQPITVETRLQNYNNMLIESLSSPDDVKTLNGFKATIRLREIIVAQVAETKTSARVAANSSSTGGQATATTTPITKTALKASYDSLRRL